MPRREAALPLLALLLLLPLAAPVVGQGGTTATPAPATFEPLPAEVRGLMASWLQMEEATLQRLRAAHPNATQPLGQAERYVNDARRLANESRLAPLLALLFQPEVVAAHQDFLATGTSNTSRERILALLNATQRAGEAAHANLTARLKDFEGRVRTTHGLEFAVQAATLAVEAQEDLRALENTTQRITDLERMEDAAVIVGLFNAKATEAYLRYASDFLELAGRVDGEGGRPQLAAGALDAMRAEVIKRVDTDPDSSSVPGPASQRAANDLRRSNASGERILLVARFAAFEAARSEDALGFLRSRGQLSDTVMRDALAQAAANASLFPRYDARLGQDVQPPLARLRSAGYHGVLLVDARNHALYRIAEDPSREGLTAAWNQWVGASYAGNALAEARGSPGFDASLLLFAGVAVAAALAVTAVALLRK